MANLDRMKLDVGQYIEKHFITLKDLAQADTTVMLPNLDLSEVWQSFSPEFTEILDPDVLNGEWVQKALDRVELIDEKKDRGNILCWLLRNAPAEEATNPKSSNQ